MTKLPNGIEVPEDQEFIWAVYSYRCVKHPWLWAVCLHEQPPRSLNPHWQEMPETRFTVCAECHDILHSMNNADCGIYLEQAREYNFPAAVRILEEYGKAIREAKNS